ncbi:hypothetical protein WME99_20900 [Sorangium sp. So ce136]|uniref:hypothetical protein n=1 Tax=Sorangium sp. So ce136 TaxID=3133284 RepID=UPI003F0DAF07
MNEDSAGDKPVDVFLERALAFMDMVEGKTRGFVEKEVASLVALTIDHPFDGRWYDVLVDIQCLFGLIDQTRYIVCDLTAGDGFDQKLHLLKRNIRQFLQGNVRTRVPPLFEVLKRWIYHEDRRIALEVVDAMNHVGVIYREKGTEDYFIEEYIFSDEPLPDVFRRMREEEVSELKNRKR